MKKYIKSFFYLVLLTSMSCETSSDIKNKEHIDKSEQIALEKIRALGFKTDSYHKVNLRGEDYLIIEKDIMFNIKKLIKKRDKQWSVSTDVVSINEVNSITWALGGFIGGNWLTAMANAESEWSGIPNCHINISPETMNLDSADIIISEFDFVAAFGPIYNSVIAIGEFPLNGEPGANVTINSGFIGSLTADEETFTMVHELGHNIGFRHTNWFDRNTDGYSGNFGDGTDPDDEGWNVPGFGNAAHILGTPWEYDSLSVMNAFVAPWTGFSAKDITAAKSLYFQHGVLNVVTIDPIPAGTVGNPLTMTLTHQNQFGGPFVYRWWTRENNPVDATDAKWIYRGRRGLSHTITPGMTMDYELGVVVRNANGDIVSIAQGKHIIVN